MVRVLVVTMHCSIWSACARPQPEQPAERELVQQAKGASNCVPRLGVKDRDYGDMARQISFYGDVLPALESRVSGYKFNCTTCHSEYRDPQYLLQVGEIDKVLTATRAEGTAFMPRIGDRLPDNYLIMLRRWRNQPVMGQQVEYNKRIQEFKALSEEAISRENEKEDCNEGNP